MSATLLLQLHEGDDNPREVVLPYIQVWRNDQTHDVEINVGFGSELYGINLDREQELELKLALTCPPRT